MIQHTEATQIPRERTVADLLFLNKLPECRAEKRTGSSLGWSALDIHGCIRGRAFILEKKKIGEHPTARQLSRMRQWAKAGAIVGWYATRAELIEIFRSHGVDL